MAMQVNLQLLIRTKAVYYSLSLSPSSYRMGALTRALDNEIHLLEGKLDQPIFIDRARQLTHPTSTSIIF
jgi:hypothetical protein